MLKMSVDAPPNQNKTTHAGPTRFRSRFPKAQPNLAISSGLARIRRISGHYPDKKENESSQFSSSPSNSSKKNLIESILSPKVISQEEEVVESPIELIEEANSIPGSPNKTFRQLINSQILSPAFNSSLFNLTSIQGTSCEALPAAAVLNNSALVYKPKFSKEHIMNIIKYKAMQKLKKIESDNLKEKRKKNKKSSVLFKNVNETTVNQEQNLNQKIDKSKLRMKDFLYYNHRVSK